MEYNSIDLLIKAMNREKVIVPRGVIGHRITINGIAQKPIQSTRWSRIIDKEGMIVGRYRKIVGFEPLKK